MCADVRSRHLQGVLCVLVPFVVLYLVQHTTGCSILCIHNWSYLSFSTNVRSWMYVARLSVCRWYGFEECLDRVTAKDILLAAHSWGRWRFALLTLLSTVVGASLSERTKSHESEIYRPGVGPTTKGGCCFIDCSIPLLRFFCGGKF